MHGDFNTASIDAWLEIVVDRGASDLLITAGAEPRMRIDGKLESVPGTERLAGESATDIIMSMLTDDQRTELRLCKEIDLSFGWHLKRARFRVNVFFQQGQAAMALRLIPSQIPTFASLGLPQVLGDFCTLPQGMVLVTGPTGSGKSTTLAAMIDRINETRPCHILTIEDPVEYVHDHKLALVNQRQVGVDTDSFDRALRAALREDPDVILVGEMRDTETIQFALTAAETGHLVFATMHTNDAAQAIDRVIDVFPVDRQAQVRVQLAACLNGVVSQRLIPRIGGGMIAAHEVMMANPAIRNVIREGKTHQLRSLIQQGARDGMETLEKAMSTLVDHKAISYEDAVARASFPREIKLAA